MLNQPLASRGPSTHATSRRPRARRRGAAGRDRARRCRASLAGEVRVAGELEGADPVRLQPVRRPDPLHRAATTGRLALAIARPVQCVASPGGSAQVSATTRRTVASGVRGLPGSPGLVAQQPVDAGLGEALLPAPDRRPADSDPPGDLGHVQPLGRMQDDPGPCRVLLRPVAIGQDRRQALAIGSRDHNTHRLCHAHHIAQTQPSVNLPNASVH